MGKLAIYYNECKDLIKSIRECADALEDENKYVSRALNDLGKISENYTELNQVYDILNKLKNQNTKDTTKMKNLNKAIQEYVLNLKEDDNRIYLNK